MNQLLGSSLQFIISSGIWFSNEDSALFGNERDKAFESLLNSVVQTFGGEYLYISIEEQAAHRLYLVEIIPSPMVINEWVPFYLFGSWKKTNSGLKDQGN